MTVGSATAGAEATLAGANADAALNGALAGFFAGPRPEDIIIAAIPATARAPTPVPAPRHRARGSAIGASAGRRPISPRRLCSPGLRNRSVKAAPRGRSAGSKRGAAASGRRSETGAGCAQELPVAVFAGVGALAVAGIAAMMMFLGAWYQRKTSQCTRERGIGVGAGQT